MRHNVIKQQCQVPPAGLNATSVIKAIQENQVDLVHMLLNNLVTAENYSTNV